jgi:hypothetical protein
MSTWDDPAHGMCSSIACVEELSESLRDGVFVQRLSEDSTSGLRANQDRGCPHWLLQKDFQNGGARVHVIFLHGDIASKDGTQRDGECPERQWRKKRQRGGLCGEENRDCVLA